MKISELQSRIFASIDSLDSDGGDQKMAIAKAREKLRGYRAAAETMRTQLEFAVRSGRIVQGSDVLPDFETGIPSATPKK